MKKGRLRLRPFKETRRLCLRRTQRLVRSEVTLTPFLRPRLTQTGESEVPRSTASEGEINLAATPTMCVRRVWGPMRRGLGAGRVEGGTRAAGPASTTCWGSSAQVRLPAGICWDEPAAVLRYVGGASVRGLVLGRVLVVLRQAVRDLEPGRLGADEDVGRRPECRCVGQRPQGDVDVRAVAHDREEE
jgi:hypothetical protein